MYRFVATTYFLASMYVYNNHCMMIATITKINIALAASGASPLRMIVDLFFPLFNVKGHKAYPTNFNIIILIHMHDIIIRTQML